MFGGLYIFGQDCKLSNVVVVVDVVIYQNLFGDGAMMMIWSGKQFA